jgi:AcrR family transcriptional regulator
MVHFDDQSAKLHSVTESATSAPSGRVSLRDLRRWETAHRITATAQALTDDRGLDGFTLDDLAAAVGVSRRTLFNYFPSKLDAVLGPLPDVAGTDVEEFCAGGPGGDLVEDLLVAARPLVDAPGLSLDELERSRRVMLSEPRLIVAAHERFDQLASELAGLLLEREGPGFGKDRATLLVRVLVVAHDLALERVLGQPDADPRAFADTFADVVRDVRAVFC